MGTAGVNDRLPGVRLKRAREQAGYRSATAAAAKLRVPLGTYTGHENGSRQYDVKAAQKYGKLFNVRASWLLTGEAPMHPGGVAGDEVDETRVTVPLGEWDPAQPDDIFDHEHGLDSSGMYEPRLPGGRPEIDVRPGAGHGQVGETVLVSANGTATGHKVISEWVFPEAFYRHELQATRSASLIMSVVGESMTPTLFPGDRIIVDTHQNQFGADGIYVFDDGDGEPRVKRLTKVLFSQQVAVTSDNPVAHQEQSVPLADLRIIGRVVGRVSRL